MAQLSRVLRSKELAEPDQVEIKKDLGTAGPSFIKT